MHLIFAQIILREGMSDWKNSSFSHIILRMSHEHIEKQVTQLIYRRIHNLDPKVAKTINESYFIGNRVEKVPKVKFPDTVNILLNSRQLWLKVEDREYTPSDLVKSFFVRKDGKEKDNDLFSVFIADRKRYVAENWGIKPHKAWNKQKHQYWDKEFVKALFTYIVVCEESDWKNKNKLEWKIRDDMTLKDMELEFAQINKKTVDIINKK